MSTAASPTPSGFSGRGISPQFGSENCIVVEDASVGDGRTPGTAMRSIGVGKNASSFAVAGSEIGDFFGSAVK
jgi:hypothetical protein